MTSDQQRQFEHVWPALSIRLHRLLSRKKVSPWLADDLVQETGLRLIRMWPEIDQAKPIWPLTATIALNLFRDEIRRAASKDSVQTLPDSPSVENVEERGLARLELRAVGGALAQMPAPQRNAILADLSEGARTTPLASSARMLRMRARRRLQHLMDHASVLGVTLGFHVRRVVRELELLVGRVLPLDAERATAAAISLLAAVSLGAAVAPGSSGSGDHPAVGVGGVGSELEGAAGSGASFTGSVASLDTAGTGLGSFARNGSDREASSRRGARGRPAGGSGWNGHQHDESPGTAEYSIQLMDYTYAHGQVEAEVTAVTDMTRDRESATNAPDSFNCTVAPSHTGASCTTTQNGSERGVRAEHRGEARVLGHRVN